MTRRRRAAAPASIVALALAVALGLPAAAAASTVAVSPEGVLTYTAAPGEENDLTLGTGTRDEDCGALGVPCLLIAEGSVAITSYTQGACTRELELENEIECRLPASVVVELGDRDDLLTDWDGPSTVAGGLGADGVFAGAGDDVLAAGDGDDFLSGGDGADVLAGGSGEDVIDGERGADRLMGDDGDDTLEGGDGDDELLGGADMDAFYGDGIGTCKDDQCPHGADRILARDGVAEDVDCGPGKDTAVLDRADTLSSVAGARCEAAERPGRSGGSGGEDGGGDPGGGDGPGGPGGDGRGDGPRGSPGGGGADSTPPSVRGLAVRRLRRGRSTTIRYVLSEPATVTLRLKRRVRRPGGEVRLVRVPGRLTRPGAAGANLVRFKGRIGGRRLALGRYRLTLVARDRAGNQGPARRAVLRVTR